MIRQFRPEDALSCCALIHACVERDPSYSAELLRNILSNETPKSMNERARLFYMAVYESEDEILGVAGLELNEIRLLYVSPNSQRRGIGRVLFEHVRAMVPNTLFADIFVYSSEQAVGFYKTCGFIDRGPFIFDVGGEPLHTVFMTYPIHEVSSPTVQIPDMEIQDSGIKTVSGAFTLAPETCSVMPGSADSAEGAKKTRAVGLLLNR